MQDRIYNFFISFIMGTAVILLAAPVYCAPTQWLYF